ncbi:hypothetical protein D1AOALGA4SA_2300 [Olavius algarvensis Delta 1 endosymbiont]|nr:hypothetical protein D1AOALGA4SA_2300 [Olavius algarvensis Delta 1 endosymbiont]
MIDIAYNLSISNWTVSSTNDVRTEFIELATCLSLNSPNDNCYIKFYDPHSDSILNQSLIQVRGNEIVKGDPVIINISVGDVTDNVMTAGVISVDLSFGQVMIFGSTNSQNLTNSYLNQTYENQSMSQIVKDMADQGGVGTGVMEIGSDYPYFVVHESKSVWQYCRELAHRDGLDLYFDTGNKLTMEKFNKSSADHVFTYGQDILDLQLNSHQTPKEQIRVYGESPASNQGPDTWHWIVKDISPFQGEVGNGTKMLSIQDGALRTKDAADNLAKAKFGAMKDQSVWGRLKILGNPAVNLMDAIEIKDAPRGELNGLFKVTSVRHLYSKQKGYVTFIGFSGHGGADAGGDLAGNF